MPTDRQPDGAVETGSSVLAVLRGLVADPFEHLVRQWNWKAALFSSAWRATIFFSVNLRSGRSAALAAAMTELVFRLITSGFYGSLTAAFRSAEPAWQAMVSAMVLLPLVAHSLEGIVHWARGTANLAASITASVLFTFVSTSFNVFAMRRGALLVGRGGQSIAQDLRRMPRLVVLFVGAILRGSAHIIRRVIGQPT